MADDLQVVVRADGSQAVKALQEVSASARATARANSDAAKAFAAAEKFAADAVTSESVRIIQMRDRVRAASKDDAQISKIRKQGLVDEDLGARAAAAAYQRLAQAKMELAEASRVHTAAEVSELQATSATVRAMEGQQGIRAVERFVSSLPGVGTALQAVFPLIGGAMFLEMLGRMGTELYDLRQKAMDSAETFRRSFDDLDRKMSEANDELALTNSRLDDEIAKLTGHPSNGLETTLLEAKLAADKLGDSLRADLKTLLQLMQAGEVSLGEGVVGGKAPTGSAAKEIQQRSNVFRDANDAAEKQQAQALDGAKAAHDKALQAAGSNQAKVKAADDAFHAAQLQAQTSYYTAAKAAAEDFEKWNAQRAQDIADLRAGKDADLERRENTLSPEEFAKAGRLSDLRSRYGYGADMTQLQEQYESAARTAREFQTRIALEQQNFTDNQTVNQLRAGKEGAATVNKAAEQKLKAMEAELAQEKLQFNVTLTAEYNFWEARKSQFQAGSDQYNAIVEKQAALAMEGARQAHEKIMAFQKSELRDEARMLAEKQRAIDAANRALYDQRKDEYNAQQERAQASDRVFLEQAAGQDRIREFQASQSASAGEAARLQQQMHQQEAERQLQVLARQYTAAQQNPYLTEAEREKQIAAVDAQIERLRQSVEMQGLEDEKRLESTTLLGGMNDALRDFIAETTNAGAVMRQVFSSSLNSTNDAILKYLTEPASQTHGRHIFGEAGHEIFTNIAGAALKGTEGNLMKMLGLGGTGKHDGSSESAALFVKLVNAAGLGSQGLQQRGGNPFGLPGLPGMNNEWGGGGVPDSIWSGFHLPDVSPAGDGSGSSSGGGIAGLISKVAGFFGGGGAEAGGAAGAGGGFLNFLGSAAGFLSGAFAGGTDYAPGGPALVGERGPEIVNLPRGSQVVPNNRIAGVGGPTYAHHGDIHVDARGATNPAEVEAAGYRGARRAIAEMGHPAAMMADYYSRRPAGRR